MAKHEKLAERLVDIIVRLNNGETLNVEELAVQYSVSKRTIQRDFNRLSTLNYAQTGKTYRLDNTNHGQLTQRDIERFAHFACIQDLLPEIDREFFLDKLNQSIIIKGMYHENIEPKKQEFYCIKEAIHNRHCIKFNYTSINDRYDPNGKKSYVIKPYRLLNRRGVWYVVGVYGEGIRAFCFSQIDTIEVLKQQFVFNDDIAIIIDENDSIYYQDLVEEIILQIKAKKSGYFERRKILPNQSTITKLENGDILVSCKHINPDELMPRIKAWMPYITVIKPTYLQEQIVEELKTYLNQGENDET